MKPNVYVTKPIPEAVEQVLRERCDVRKWQGQAPMGYDDLKREIGDADGLLTATVRVDGPVLQQAPNLKVISTISVGYNNMDIEAMKARGIIGTHTPEVLNDAVADVVFGLMLSCARRMPELDRLVKTGGWTQPDLRANFGMDVHHATLGILGMGRIGEVIAKRAKFGFDMNVLYHNRSRKASAEEKYGAQYRSIGDLFAEADFVVVLVPLSPETENLVRAEHFARMKPTAFFINAARGQVVDESDLIEALRQGLMRGAGLDVYVKEPIDPSNPLLTMDNVVTMPHIGSATDATRFAMAMLAARNLVAALHGETPPNLIPEFRS